MTRAIADLAWLQHGVVARRQLLALGLHPRAIDRRIAAGQLHPIHRGVYLVGHPAPTVRARNMAAILACAQPVAFATANEAPGFSPESASAVLSHRSAAAFWELLPCSAAADVCVTVTRRACPKHSGIVVHSTTRLERRDFVIRDGIPVTTASRAVLEIAASVTEEQLEQAIAEGYARRFLSERHLRDQIQRNPGRRGAGALRTLLNRATDPAFTRSRAERILLGLIRGAGLPEPEANTVVDGREVDFVWREHRVVAEVDGWAFHSDPQAFQRDRVRTNALQLAGYVVLRFTWRRLTEAPEQVEREIREALGLLAGTPQHEGGVDDAIRR